MALLLFQIIIIIIAILTEQDTKPYCWKVESSVIMCIFKQFQVLESTELRLTLTLLNSIHAEQSYSISCFSNEKWP